MKMHLRRWRFSQTVVDDAPDTKGVYVLWDHQQPLGVGRALGGGDTIRGRLKRHLFDSQASGVALATHYSWEICRDPLTRATELELALGLCRDDATAENER